MFTMRRVAWAAKQVSGLTIVGFAGAAANGVSGIATITLPAGVAAGDLVIAYAAHPARQTTSNPIMNSTGYTAIDGGSASADQIAGRAWWKIMGATPDSTVSIQHPSSLGALTTGVVVIRGANASAIASFATQAATFGLLTAPAITPTVPGAMLVSIGGAIRDAINTGDPTGLAGYTSSVVGVFPSVTEGGSAMKGATGVACKLWTGGAESATAWTYSDPPFNRYAHGYIIEVRPA